MNKIVKSILSFFCAALLLGSLTACQAVSAYDIAVKNGYQGTEEQWLASLHGENGKDGKDGADLTAADIYDTAVEKGYEGTYLDFCRDVLQVEPKDDNNDVDTIASNVTSVVSIYCEFTLVGYDWWGRPVTSSGSSAGSGVVIDLDKEEGDALIVTNYHVVYDASCNTETGISDSIYLYPYGAYGGYQTTGDGIKATYVGGAMNYDIAILRVDNSEYIKQNVVSKADFANSDGVRVGEKVYAVGNPDGAGISITEGIVSVESEYITMTSTDGSNKTVDYRVLRTDAAINSGNSGGALFNAEGGLIGIVNAKNASSNVDNMGYALPSTQVNNLCRNILDNHSSYGDGAARVATLGAKVAMTGSKAYYDESGALRIEEEFTVAQMESGGAAEKLLMVGDVFKTIQINDGETFTFTRRYQLLDKLLTVRKGDKVTLGIVREGTNMKVDIVFSEDAYFTRYA